MTFLNTSVANEYWRVRKMLGDNDPYQSSNTMGIVPVLTAHFLLVDTFLGTKEAIGGVGPRSLDLLHSALARQFTSFGSIDKWQDHWEKCATLTYGLVKNHPFYDANKRTALLIALAFLQQQKHVITLPQKLLDRFMVAIAENRLEAFFSSFSKADKKRVPQITGRSADTPIYQIAEFLRRNSRHQNNMVPLVTFNSLNQALKPRGYELANPNGNFIDIIRNEPDRKTFFGGLIPGRQVKIGQVGFPSWKSKISRNAIKTIRDVTGLTARKGFDSDVLFNGEEALDSLISEYMEPLRRLAYK